MRGKKLITELGKAAQIDSFTGDFSGVAAPPNAFMEALAHSLGTRYSYVSPRADHRGGPMQLKLNTRTLDGVTVVDCNGRIVFGEESAILRDTLKKLINENKRVVLNLGGISYIDSGGLGTLVALYTTAHNAGGTVKLARLTQRVGDLLQVTKLVTIFEVFDTEEKAVESFRKGVAA